LRQGTTGDSFGSVFIAIGDLSRRNTMKRLLTVLALSALAILAALSIPVIAQEKAEKKKAERAAGDVGLLDLEKNYMILVTKEGKLITLDFNNKTKVTQLDPKNVKMGDVGLGSAAVVEYQSEGEKNIVTKMEVRPVKGGE
jgi:hypothetical protein